MLFRASPTFWAVTRLRSSGGAKRRLFSRLWRSSRFGRAFARLIELKFFSQLLNQCRYFLLPLRLDLLSERLFDFSAFLDVTGFESSALLGIELKPRVANCRICVACHNLTSRILSLAHEVALLRSLLHPKLGVTLKILPRIWRHREPAVPYALSGRCPVRLTGWRPMRLTWRWPVWRCHLLGSTTRRRHWRRPASRAARLLRLRLRGSAAQNKGQTDE